MLKSFKFGFSCLSPVLSPSVNGGVAVIWERSAQLNASAEQGACEGWGTGRVPPGERLNLMAGSRGGDRKAGCEEVTDMGRAHGRSRAPSWSWREPGRWSVQFSRPVVSDSLRPPWTAARQASLSFTNSRSLLKRMCIESAMPCNHLIAQWMKGRAVWDGQEPDPAETSRPWVTKNVSICPGTVASHWRVGNLGRDTIGVLFIKSGIIPAARCWGRDGERGFRTHLP